MDEPILTMEERESINAGRWFSSLSPSLRHDILRCAYVKRYKDGELIAARGEPPEQWIACAKGAVRVSSTSVSGTAEAEHGSVIRFRRSRSSIRAGQAEGFELYGAASNQHPAGGEPANAPVALSSRRTIPGLKPIQSHRPSSSQSGIQIQRPRLSSKPNNPQHAYIRNQRPDQTLLT